MNQSTMLREPSERRRSARDRRKDAADRQALASGLPGLGLMEADDLRKRAEALVAEDVVPTDMGQEPLPPDAMLKILHELQVHQIELEMQNEELHLGQVELEKAQARYFDLYDMAPVGFLTLSEYGLILEANLTAGTLLGLPRTDLIHQPISKFILRECQDTYHLQRRQLLETGELKGWDLRMVKADQTPFWVRLTANVRQDSFGTPLCHLVMSDITERKQAEIALQQANVELESRVDERTRGWQEANEKLRAESAELRRVEATLRRSEERLQLILKGSKDAPWDWDVEHDQMFYSPRWWEMLGYEVDALPNDSGLWERLLHPDDHAQVNQVFHGALNGESDSYEVEFRLRHQDGHYVPLLSRGFILRDTQGKPARVSGTNTDLTERRQVEAIKAELIAQKSELRKAESLDLMAGAIAHHFNNKLQAVLASLEVLEGLPPGTDPTRFLAMAKHATDQASEVSRSLMLYLGGTPGQREPVLLSELCRTSLPLFQEALPNSVALEVDCPSPGPRVSADAHQLQQALVNLITNAREAYGPAPGTIHLRVKTCQAENIATINRFPIGWQPKKADYACLEVEDSGCGIAGTDLGRVFDPFFSTKFSSPGVGLSVVLGVFRSHGGVITVESQPFQGSIFRAYLPVMEDENP